MILAPVMSASRGAVDSPISVRLIGVLDRVLIESFADACAGLAAAGPRTLIVLMRDLAVMRDESLDRFLSILAAQQTAGHRVFVNGTPAWRKIAGARGARFTPSAASAHHTARRQIIICHSLDKGAGAA